MKKVYQKSRRYSRLPKPAISKSEAALLGVAPLPPADVSKLYMALHRCIMLGRMEAAGLFARSLAHHFARLGETE